MENTNLNKGMLLPQAIDLEEGVIGAMMVDSKGVEEAMAIITSEEVFYKETHKHIFVAIRSLFNAGNPIDLLTVPAELRKLGTLDLAGGDFNLIQLTQKIASSAHIEYHCYILVQKFMARKTIMFSNQIIALAYNDTTDIFELMNRWQKEFDKVMDFTNTGRSTMSFPDALQNLKKEVELLSANKNEVQLVGVDTGFKRLNKYTGGYRNQDLIIIAARPKMGKTSYVLKCAIENCKKNVGVGFVSLEMSMAQLTARAVAIDTNFHLKQLLKTGFDKPEYFNTYSANQQRMNGYPFYIDDSGKNDINDVIIIAKLWLRKFDIKVLIIDYLQLMVDKSIKGNREGEIGSISRRLKKLAKELNIPIIVLSQLSRAVESRPGKRPQLSDLRDSGSIEQDADMVQFIFRPDYYKLEIDPEDYTPEVAALIPLGANTEIDIAAYRSGSVNTTLLQWIGDKTKFKDVEDDYDTVTYIDAPTELPKINPSEAFDASEDLNHFM